ncbi:hypothetical protein [Cohaesibacter celericrescens]|uniref:Uncharacterized protein n=1 Tax=Cohaesibacter celericrescens TaxID=2067669 RepID=A0A2N5XSJ2_9HYPH|nr:hypothetical protein [Cohaesibacter celericrescens]PLW77415.1 hypothetical protein C0081_08750 [Cohaesibacter celericrescens]
MTIGADNHYEWIVVHGDAQRENSEGLQSALVEQCYSDREPYGEYILYAAGDSGAVSEGQISVLNYAYLAEVRVTFEPDLVAEGISDIGWCLQDHEEQGDAFVKEIWPSWQDASLNDVANTIFPPDQDFVMARSVLSVSDDHASWVEVTRVEAHQPTEMALTFCRVEQDRLLEIKAVLKDPDVPVWVLSDMWNALVMRFQNLSYEKLTGANRIEPDVDMEEFDIDLIGDVAGEA